MKILVSACLMGVKCKYNGGDNLNPTIKELCEQNEYLCVCPECLGGLSTPRYPSEIQDNKVINSNGEDVSQQYNHGAQLVLNICEMENIDLAILKSKSPACGFGFIYDGSFTKTLVRGNGVCAQLLLNHGYRVINSEDDKIILNMMNI